MMTGIWHKKVTDKKMESYEGQSTFQLKADVKPWLQHDPLGELRKQIPVKLMSALVVRLNVYENRSTSRVAENGILRVLRSDNSENLVVRSDVGWEQVVRLDVWDELTYLGRRCEIFRSRN